MTATATRTAAVRDAEAAAQADDSRRIAEMLSMVAARLPVQRRIVHAGDVIYTAGERFTNLFVLNSGIFKIINTSDDGREQMVGLHFKGDWLGFDGIARGSYGCDAVAMDTGEVWSLRYDTLMQACREHAPLLMMLHDQMSREITRDRDSMLALCTLGADARVADFLRYWADSLARRGLRNDQITLRMSRAEIGNYLGMTLETVSRALSRLARHGAIRFKEKGRRDIEIPDLKVLADFIQQSPRPAAATLQ